MRMMICPKAAAFIIFFGSAAHFEVHLLLVELFAGVQSQLVNGGFYDDHGAIHDQSEIDSAQAHQVAAYTKEVHQRNGKEHGQRYH